VSYPEVEELLCADESDAPHLLRPHLTLGFDVNVNAARILTPYRRDAPGSVFSRR